MVLLRTGILSDRLSFIRGRYKRKKLCHYASDVLMATFVTSKKFVTGRRPP